MFGPPFSPTPTTPCESAVRRYSGRCRRCCVMTPPKQAIAIANDSDYGLHGAVFTTDAQRAAEVARQVRAGTFSVNAFVYNTEAPFGGVKISGIGRDTGPEAVHAY